MVDYRTRGFSNRDLKRITTNKDKDFNLICHIVPWKLDFLEQERKPKRQRAARKWNFLPTWIGGEILTGFLWFVAKIVWLTETDSIAKVNTITRACNFPQNQNFACCTTSFTTFAASLITAQYLDSYIYIYILEVYNYQAGTGPTR